MHETPEQDFSGDQSIIQSVEEICSTPRGVTSLVHTEYTDHPSAPGTFEWKFANLPLHKDTTDPAMHGFNSPYMPRLSQELIPLKQIATQHDMPSLVHEVVEAKAKINAISIQLTEYANEKNISVRVTDEDMIEHGIGRRQYPKATANSDTWMIFESQKGGFYFIQKSADEGNLFSLDELAKREPTLVSQYIYELYHQHVLLEYAQTLLKHGYIHEAYQQIKYPNFIRSIADSRTPEEDLQEFRNLTHWASRWDAYHAADSFFPSMILRQLSWGQYFNFDDYSVHIHLTSQEVLSHIQSCPDTDPDISLLLQRIINTETAIEDIQSRDFRYTLQRKIPQNEWDALCDVRSFTLSNQEATHEARLDQERQILLILTLYSDTTRALSSPESFLQIMKNVNTPLFDRCSSFLKFLENNGVDFTELTTSFFESNRYIFQFTLENIQKFLLQSLSSKNQLVDTKEKPSTSFSKLTFSQNPELYLFTTLYFLAHIRNHLIPLQMHESSRKILHNLSHDVDKLKAEQSDKIEFFESEYNAIKNRHDILKAQFQESTINISELASLCEKTVDYDPQEVILFIVNLLSLHNRGLIDIHKPFFSDLLDDVFPWVTIDLKNYLLTHARQRN